MFFLSIHKKETRKHPRGSLYFRQKHPYRYTQATFIFIIWSPMNLNLSHKFFIVSIGIILVLTSISISLSYISSKTLLSKAMNGVDVKAMKYLSIGLSEYYKENQAWDGYAENKNLWGATVNSIFFKIFLSLSEPPTPAQIKKLTIANSNIIPQPPKGKPICDPPFGSFLQRLSLLDANKQEVVAPEILKNEFNFQKIKLNGKTVGWLKVGKLNVDSLPLGEQIFQQQLKLTSWVTIFGAILAIMLSYVLSRHITAPIKKLTSHAKQIAKRDFQSTIEINTTDELRDLAQSFNTISKELNLYDTRQKQWLMDISHELRTPLTILMGEVSAICDNLTKCDTAAVASLQEEVMQIKRLVDDLDDISTIDKIGFSLNKQTIDLQQLISYHKQRYQKKFSDKGIGLHIELPPSPIFIFGDIDRIAQIIINLFENCLRYTEYPGDVWLHTKIEEGNAVLVIEDSGPGVPTESINKIFDRLYRTDSSRNRNTGGSGLGLTICKQIAIAHNGKIAASHSKKGGLCICTTLPIADKNTL